jgi:hypothetical protein
MGYGQSFGEKSPGDMIIAGSPLGSVSGTVTSLTQAPGYYLGDKRYHNGVKYELVYNAGNSEIPPGYSCLQATWTVAGVLTPYSVTITTTTEGSQGHRGMNNNATAVTGTYFWMAYEGFPVSLVASNISIATGARVGVALSGKFVTTDSVNCIVGTNVGDLASGTACTDARATNGRFYINYEHTRGRFL